MPSPYSNDLRQKAVSAIERGEKKSHVCRTLDLSRNTLDLWLKRMKQTGSFKACRNYSRGPKPKIDDLQLFEKFAQKHGHLTHQEMAQLWGNDCSRTRICQALKKIGFSRKKAVRPR